jgi:hypothetical protein
VLHTDVSFRKEGDDRFTTTAGDVKLSMEILEPVNLQSAIESNIVTAPGPPGSVDKGERQQRGQKLLLSTSRPITTALIVLRLKFTAAASE